MGRRRQLGVRGQLLQNRVPGDPFAVAGVGREDGEVDQRRHGGAHIELIIAIEIGAGDPDQLRNRVEIECDAFAAEAQADPQRFFQADEGDAVFAEDAVEAFRPDGEDVGERRKGLVAIALAATGGAVGRRVDRGAQIAASAQFHRHRHDRIL